MQVSRRSKFQFLKKPSRRRPHAILAGSVSALLAGSLAALLGTAQPAAAASIIWNNATGGSWGATGNWYGGIIPSNPGDIADFSQLALTSAPTVTLDANQTVGTLIFGATSGAFNWTLANGTGGPWALTLAAASGTPVINVVNNSATISAVLAGTSGFNKIGAGNLILSATNTYTGTTTVSGGTLTLDFSLPGAPIANIINSASGLALQGGGTLVLKGNPSATNSQTFAGLSVGSGADVITLTQNGATSLTAVLGAITQTAGGTLNFGTAPSTTGILATTTNSPANGILGPWATVNTGTSTQYATINGSNQIVAYTGATAATAALLVGAGNTTTNFTFGAAISLSGNSAANTLQYTGAAITQALAAKTLTLNGLLNTGSGTLTFTRTGAGGIVIGSTNELVILGPASVTITAPIGNNGSNASSLTYSGTGTLTLNTASTYTGTTTVNSGTVTLGVANVLANTSSVVVNGGTLANTTFAQTVSGLSLTGGTLTGGTGALTSTTAFNVQSGSDGAILAGTVGLNKTTPGTVSVTMANTYTGVTTIDGGILNAGIFAAVNTASSIGKGSAGGSAADIVFGGGTLQYTGTTAAATTNRLFTIGDANGNSATIDSSSATAADGLAFTGTGSIAFANAAAHSLTLTGSNTGTANTFAPIIGDQSAGNITSVTKNGAGTWALTGTNTYSGVTTIDGGILNVKTFAAVNTASSIGKGSAGGSAADIVFGGGTLQYTTAAPATTNRLFTIGDANGNGATIDSSAALAANTLSFTGTGSIAFANATTHSLTLTGTNPGSNLFAPLISDQSVGNATSLTESSSGTWVLTGANTYTGGTTITSGTLQIGAGGTVGALGSGAVTDNGTLVFNRTDNYGGPVNNAISGSGAASLLGGALTLGGTNTYLGATSVSSGTLTLDFTQAGAPTTNIISSSSALTLGGSTLNVIGNASTTNSQTFAGLALNLGASSITDSNNATSNSLLIALGAITRNAGGIVNFTLPSGTNSASNGITTSNSNTNGILGGYATVGQSWATISGTNIIPLPSASYYTTTTGGTTASNYANVNAQVTSTLTLGGVITPNSIYFANTTAYTVTLPTGTSTIESGGILVSSAATKAGTLTGGTITSGNGQDLIVIQNGGAALTISSVIADNGATPIGLTKAGTGLLKIGTTTTNTGTTNILAGTLQLGVGNALKIGSAVRLGDAGANTGGTLDLNGFGQSLSSLSSVGTGASLVTNSTSTAVTLTVTAAAASNFGGVIQDGASTGGVAVTLAGGGTGVFTGANTYTGLTTIQNYTLTLAGGNSRLSASDPVFLNNSGKLILGNSSGASNQTVSSLTVGTNTANWVRGGSATQTSTLTVNYTNTAVADVFAGTAGANAYLGSGTADTTVVTAANNLALTKTGVGTFALGGNGNTLSTYDGGTNINQGTLALGLTNVLPGAVTLTYGTGTLTTGAVNINGGTLDLASFSSVAGLVTLGSGSIADSVGGGTLHGTGYAVQNGTLSAVLGDGSSPSALTKTTAGTVTLSAANTYTGGTNVSAGTLILGAANALPATGTANLTGGTLALGAANGLAAGGSVNVNGGTLDLASFSSSAGAVTLTSGIIVDSIGGGVLSASSYAVQSGTISAVIGGTGSTLTKTTSGTVTLSAANTYSGLTSVNAGTLNVSTAQTGGGAFSVGDSGALNVNIAAAGQTLATSALTLGNTTGGTLAFNLGTLGNPVANVISTTTLTLNGTTAINLIGGVSVGEFPLIAYSGSILGGGSLVQGTLPARTTANLDTSAT
jgi:autotransporter-associated beta strand protein